ncbi:kielin/chordin-like protein isoform X2 [Cydia strobilella]|uniref:kielin/chordin-like protein isoform X2 n=1 Tax=Cydia strobilella TaxID=1100964 RepID=UPI003004CF28
MKWLVLSCFLLWARHGEGGALKCLPEDDACSSQLSQEVEQQEIDIRRPSSTDAPAECLSGSEWDSNCHKCRCVAGEAQCVRQSGCDSIEEPIRCKPNTTFGRDCNTCRCLENGLGICTIMECASVTTEAVPSKPIIPKGVDCAPGTTWQSQCNECVCSPEGRRYCTDKACPGQQTEALLRCAPQSQWKNDCNMCWCNSGRAMCTKMGCVALPSDMHFDDRKGDAETAEIPEPATKAVKNVTKKVCVENRMFIMNCNTCWCNEDGTSYFCTRKVCLSNTDEPVVEEGTEKLRIIKKECRPGEVFEIECNMCHCNPDGKTFSCTRRACFDEDKNQTLIRKTRATPQEAPKNCQPGQEFRMDCNKCLCDNEGQNFSCTRIDCLALNNNNNNGNRRKRDVSQKVSADCVPGSVFEQGCNVCRCTEDGGHATCTLKRCQTKEDSTLTATESSFRCNPGEQFKQSCNDCSCSADGKSVFCTLLVCDDDLSP